MSFGAGITTAFFMFSSKEAAQHFELGYAIFYGAAYDFYEGDASSIYKDLKNKKYRHMPGLYFLIKATLTRILRKEFYCYIIIRSVIKEEWLSYQYGE